MFSFKKKAATGTQNQEPGSSASLGSNPPIPPGFDTAFPSSANNSFISHQSELVPSLPGTFENSLDGDGVDVPLPPIVFPPGGTFAKEMGGVKVSLGLQGATTRDDVVHWRFEMVPLNYPAGPSFEGRIPGRKGLPFEEGYEVAPQKIGYRPRPSRQNQLEFQTPAVYKVYAWVSRPIRDETGKELTIESATQYSVYQITDGPNILPSSQMTSPQLPAALPGPKKESRLQGAKRFLFRR